MSTVVLVRPGCTDFDEQRRLQGTLQLPLNSRGLQQTARLIERLKDLPIEAVVTGTCEPCLSTAQAIAQAMHIKLRENDELCNFSYGLWQGLNIDEVRRKFPRVYKQWEEAPETVCPPEGETVVEVMERIEAALRKPLKKYDMFAIVASEPLASLISCALRGVAPEDVCSSMFACCEDQLIDILQTDSTSDSVTLPLMAISPS